MENTKQFTNEELSKKFRNNFDLVNYAILLAENMIQSGRDPRVRRSEIQNRAMLILEEIKEGNDIFVEITTDSVKTQDFDEKPHYERFPEREKEKKRSFKDSFDDEDDED